MKYEENTNRNLTEESITLLKNEWFSDEFDDLQKAKHYYGNIEISEEDEYLGDDYNSYVNDFNEYIENIWNCDSLEELANVLNSRSEYSNGLFKIEKI